MKHKLNIVCTYLGAMTIGGYLVSEIKFHQHIELYRWIITSFFFLFFILQIKYEEK